MAEASSAPEYFLPRDARTWFALLGLAAAVFFYLLLIRTALIDDAFITLRYAKTLLQSGTWGFYPGHISNTATSPLNVLLLALFSIATGSPRDSVVWLTLTEFIVLAVFLRGIGKVLGLRLFALLAFVGLICNPLLMSTLGLESVLFATLLVGALYFYTVSRFDAMALACALLTLTRPDGILFFAICVLAGPTNLRMRIRTLGIYALYLSPWYLFSWFELGSIVPDTLIIKLNQSWGHYTFINGVLLYLRHYPLETILSFLFAPFATLALRRPIRSLGPCVYVLTAYAVLYYTAYSLLGVPPYHWYYVPVVLCIVLLGALAAAQLLRDTAGISWRKCHPAAVVALVLPVAGVAALFVRDGVPLREAWIHTNWATHAQYRSVGEWLRNKHAGETGSSDGEIGTISYYCDCMLRDEFSERNWLDARVQLSQNGTTLRALVNRINYWFYAPQVPFDRSTYMVSYIQMYREYVDTGQRWRVGTRWERNGIIVFNRFGRR